MDPDRMRADLRCGLKIAAAAAIVLTAGCAPTGVSRTPSEPRAPAEAEQPPEAERERYYDLDAEPSADAVLPPGYVEEDFEPLANDTFHVEEATPAEPQPVYGIGYRVQIFASGELESAREIQKNFMAGTGLAAYIEYENGLYKVRAGDFATRDEAAEARAALSGKFPGCWIVQTTIETGR